MSDAIDLDLVHHVARLSRIELSDEWAGEFRRQLADILSYFDKLQELDTEAVEPLVHPVELNNVLAGDVSGTSLTPEAALVNAPQRDGDYFMVPKVIGESA